MNDIDMSKLPTIEVCFGSEGSRELEELLVQIVLWAIAEASVRMRRWCLLPNKG